MSELINNREHRRNVLKELITELHNGKSVEDVKQRFEETFEGVSASEISEVEQALIMDGMPVSEVQRLCDVHAAVFKGSIEEIHKVQDLSEEPGHPLDIMKRENRAIENVITNYIRPHLESLTDKESDDTISALIKDLDKLNQINIHYQKKENILFPYLEKYGIVAPPKVMWGVDDEVRQLIKDARALLNNGEAKTIKAKFEETLSRITEMIFKEENILFPMMMETISPDEWKHIADDSTDYGYCLLDSAPQWSPNTLSERASTSVSAGDEEGVNFPTGTLKLNEMNRLMDTLPFDITFVDKDDKVKYFSQGTDRIFPRTKSIIGREVTNCHPPASVHIVEKIVYDFKNGVKDQEDFWIRMGEKYVLIRYFAVRDEASVYLGTLEVTQDIAPIQEINGEKRLAND